MLLIEYPNGERYAVANAAVAKRAHPDARIVSHEDGTPYEAPKPRPARKRPSQAKKAAPAAVVTEASNGSDH